MSPTRNDLELYERHAGEWADPRSRVFRSLRAIKAHHLALLQGLASEAARPDLAVDLGCGGGLLAVPLAELATCVVGLDRSPASLAAARTAAGARGAHCHFLQADLAQVPLASGCADLVLLSDVLEHVEEPAAGLREAARLLRPGGKLFVNTLNATRRARFLAVTLAESIGLVPRGTHDPRLFIAPERLVADAAAAGLRLVRIEGEVPRVWRTLCTWAIHVRASASLAVAYNAVFERAR